MTQHSKLKSSGLESFFTNVITSEGSNSLKPQKEIFDYALNKAAAKVEESLMIGDSIEVDIAGAIAAGMDQVHVNYNAAEQSLTPTYTITALNQLKDFL
jgi:putative hydrolase of the HAD superfamily